MSKHDLSIDEILSIELTPVRKVTETKRRKVTCPKCQGKKQLGQYRHFKHGKCFSCNGKGFIVKE